MYHLRLIRHKYQLKTFQVGLNSSGLRAFQRRLPSLYCSICDDKCSLASNQLELRSHFSSQYVLKEKSSTKLGANGLIQKSPAKPECAIDLYSRALLGTNTSSQKGQFNKIINDFPDGIQMAFAYGSGAIQQNNSKLMSQNMLDFIFVVDKPKKWHRLNLQRNPHHYSFLKRFGPKFIAKFQDKYGAGVYFNTLVPMQGRLIKYGVISTARLITDLLDWESLYVSGRLHKPVRLIIIPTDKDLLKALLVNLESAVHSALLLLPDMFTEEQFYITIASLSYAGDIRMSFAEDSNKVKNIVSPNLPMFRQLYLPLITKQEHLTFWPKEGQLEQALSFHSRHHHLTQLPCHVLHGLLMHKYRIGVFPDLEEIIHLHAHDSECATHIYRSIKHIVQKSSTSQTMKGFLTAGFLKSIRYSMKKFIKKLKSS